MIYDEPLLEKGSMATALEVAALAAAPRWRGGNEQQHQNQ